MQDIWNGIQLAETNAATAELDNKRISRILTVMERQKGLSTSLTNVLGQRDTWESVSDALCEIIASAMLALATVEQDPEQALAQYLGTAETTRRPRRSDAMTGADLQNAYTAPPLAAESLNAFGRQLVTPESIAAGMEAENERRADLAATAREKSADQRPRKQTTVMSLGDRLTASSPLASAGTRATDGADT